MEELPDAPLSPLNPPIVENVVDVVVDALLPDIEPSSQSPVNVSSILRSSIATESPKLQHSYLPSEKIEIGNTNTANNTFKSAPESPKSPPSYLPSEKIELGNTKAANNTFKSAPESPNSPPSYLPSEKIELGNTKAANNTFKSAPESPKSPHSYPPSVKSELGSAKAANIASKSQKPPSIKTSLSSNKDGSLVKAVDSLEPQGKIISDNVEKLSASVKSLADDVKASRASGVTTEIDKIAKMSKALTFEAKALRDSIKCLSEDIIRTKQELCSCSTEEDVNFPYHLFLIEMIINKIHMKCECFDIDYNNLVISATFLGKQPIILYDSSYGKIENFSKLNVGKSTLFAMTYDKICSVKEFEIVLLLTKQPPCSTCVTKIGETHMDYTSEFVTLREELCSKWREQQPTDNILCTTSTPLSKNMYYLSCGSGENSDSIGIIEVTVRMSFLGKEITTAFCAQPKPQGTSFLLKDDHGMAMYSCQRVEMDDQGKILLEEGVMSKKSPPCIMNSTRHDRPYSHVSNSISNRSYEPPSHHGNYAGLGEFRIRDLNDEINKLMREKRHWEVQIKTLGGPDHARVGPKMLDQDGKEVPGNRGYKYFGAAKDLPGVRELFEQEPPPPPRRTRADLMRDVDADYYGYRDDDDGLLMPLEQEFEKEAIAKAVEKWKKKKEENKEQDMSDEENIYPEDPDDKRLEDEDAEPGRPVVTSHVAVPSQKDIEEALLRRKKQELLEKYGCMDVDVKLEES